MSESTEDRPFLRIVRGEPTDAELAALTAVITAAATPEQPAEQPHSAWSDRSAAVRRPLAHGPGAWRASALNR
ncbi:acyl-CoA carboxylase subunit epsilon [Actinokineospora enzanensis]|uniref:acyl-CoA carboxylase subunit epsilon n=1 Tax=Actinokineospora enzanensis TaxID=155975 RepID=UPI00036D555B|nr:acyl-CoA carboxylase subunit epsilon [Actinokineospora enzanensis]